ncbi:hypothetical protein ACWER6_23010 [Streptomyces sp. NPDC004009]
MLVPQQVADQILADLNPGFDHAEPHYLLVRRFFGSRLNLAFRDDVDGEGDFGFDVLLPRPFEPECTGQARAPVYSVTDLHEALTGTIDSAPRVVRTAHGGPDDVAQEKQEEFSGRRVSGR